MGCHVALEMLTDPRIENLILFYPAIYTDESYEISFDEKFTEIIRKHESWRNTSVLNNLHNFKGNILVVWGDKDSVIPKEVVDLIISSARNARYKELFIVPDGEHLLLPKFYSDVHLRSNLLGKIKRVVCN